ncbi:hypothetical protein SAMN06269185_0473 [Natronoarchaeum philippinense]|uniref:Transcriptional regulator n=1 Tax=Natronoarchaeum philippinense TaxID=558529 RepID=A0A285N878_NATPI|nr:DUF5821 family protein [Natronoarchaeum philippinense]SNZ04176.1 hypothetical protein SAMN06269185_0473 [Natronoarchaeum philippinense]
MSDNILDRTREELVRDAVETAADGLLVRNPSAETIRELVSVLSDADDRPAVRLLGQSGVVKNVMSDFIVASSAADLVEDGTLEVRASESVTGNPLLIHDDAVVAVVTAGQSVAGLVSDDDSFVADARDAHEQDWAAAETYPLRTPPLSAVHDGLSKELGEHAEQDFRTMLDSLETARGDGDGLDEVTISLLVAAKNEELLYDVSKWGEDTGVASKATFSRTKTELENMGLIDTEKVPIDVGRPRLRLKLGDERLEDADNDQLATVAQSMLN